MCQSPIQGLDAWLSRGLGGATASWNPAWVLVSSETLTVVTTIAAGVSRAESAQSMLDQAYQAIRQQRFRAGLNLALVCLAISPSHELCTRTAGIAASKTLHAMRDK